MRSEWVVKILTTLGGHFVASYDSFLDNTG